MVWIPGESIFDRLLSFKSSPKPEYYHCIKNTKGVRYESKIVQGEHRIIPIYPDMPKSTHLQILEGVLDAPATIATQ
jgi:hypothetical protein